MRALAAMIPAERDLIEITVGVLDREPVPDAYDGALECRVEALSCVRVRHRCGERVTAHILTLAVVDVQMGGELATDPAIGRKLVGDEHRLSDVEVGEHEGRDGSLRMCFAFCGASTAITLSGDSDHALAGARAPHRLIVIRIALGRLTFLALLAAKVSLVRLDDAFQQVFIVLHHAPDALTEEPCRLLADAEVFRQPNRRNALAGRCYEIKRGEPRPHRQMRAFERRSVRHPKATLAGVAASVVRAAYEVRIVDAAAVGTHRAVRPTHGFQMRPTGVIIRESLEEGEQRHDQRIPNRPRKSIGPKPFKCFVWFLGAILIDSDQIHKVNKKGGRIYPLFPSLVHSGYSDHLPV